MIISHFSYAFSKFFVIFLFIFLLFSEGNFPVVAMEGFFENFDVLVHANFSPRTFGLPCFYDIGKKIKYCHIMILLQKKIIFYFKNFLNAIFPSFSILFFWSIYFNHVSFIKFTVCLHSFS